MASKRYTCPYCKWQWDDRGTRESFVCNGCGAGPSEFAESALTGSIEQRGYHAGLEAAARICDGGGRVSTVHRAGASEGEKVTDAVAATFDHCAAAIRARIGQKEGE